jgi:hypothetical protein
MRWNDRHTGSRPRHERASGAKGYSTCLTCECGGADDLIGVVHVHLADLDVWVQQDKWYQLHNPNMSGTL